MKRRTFLSSTLLAGLGGPVLAALGQQAPGPAASLPPFYLPPGPALQPGPAGVAVRTRVRHGQTRGQFSCIEGVLAPKTMGPAPHVHRELDELMHVLEGTVHVLVGTEVCEVRAGGWHFRPHGVPHTFWNSHPTAPARFVDMFFHQNLEDYLEELFAQLLPEAERRGWAPGSPQLRARLDALNARYGIVEFHDRRAPLMRQYGLK
ncbi:cupin domain-containing protein [Hymenobacter sp. BT523]|uniref:cupin domain-containing protein n=1 Tax=Hymenobacter sp. BT523 TaxID=2795725 RepID=UPI0018EB2661|nr:cupin domain-containing protein [Hymenobacter sp. BT523]MBJ6108478.1 cupin domain-containing protein [Hymenobacter sp. BT523]